MDNYDKYFSELDQAYDPEYLRQRFAKAREQAKPRTPWQRFKDTFLEGAVHAPIGAEGVVRATTDLSSEELNKRERILSDKLRARREWEDATLFGNVDTLSPANIV
jgi:hypothetical protein